MIRNEVKYLPLRLNIRTRLHWATTSNGVIILYCARSAAPLPPLIDLALTQVHGSSHISYPSSNVSAHTDIKHNATFTALKKSILMS